MSTHIAQSAVLYDRVSLGEGTIVDEFVLLGVVPRGYRPDELQTQIGPKGLIRSHTTIYAGNIIGTRFSKPAMAS